MRTDQFEDIRDKILDRRDKLISLAQKYITTDEVEKLLEEIDAALERMKNGSFGKCEICGDPIEVDRLEIDPLLTFCLDHLNTQQQRSLENDLKLAMKIQRNLLPPRDLKLPGWDVAYHYEPASLVSGDYCDLIPSGIYGHNYLVVGDVSGKGIAASMLMTHLHAMFHTLIPLNLPSDEVMKRINSLFCESTISTQFATLLLAIAYEDGKVEISNAGHCFPIFFSQEETRHLESDGIPLGIVCNSTYESKRIQMKSNDILFVYTDGLSEAMKGEELFDISQIENHDETFRNMTSQQIVDTTINELNYFLKGSVKDDDLTLLVLKKL